MHLPPGVIALDELEVSETTARDVATRWLADPKWRERLGELAPLPAVASFADPTRAGEVTARLAPRPAVAGVVALRLSTALLGVSVAERLGVPVLIDADDDDVDLLAHEGRAVTAGAWERLAALTFGSATLVTLAGAADADRIRRRHALGSRVEVVPNAVAVPDPATLDARPGQGRIVLVANLTYGPNIEGARWLVREVLPLLEDHWTIDLVGAPGDAVRELAGPRVGVHGYVDSVRAAYGRADVAVAPLLTGSGSRLKVIEAMAHRRAVVSTSVGCAGLEVEAGRDLLVADRPEDFARAIDSLRDERVAGRLVAASAQLVARLYDAEATIESTGRVLRSAIVGTHERIDSVNEGGSQAAT